MTLPKFLQISFFSYILLQTVLSTSFEGLVVLSSSNTWCFSNLLGFVDAHLFTWRAS